MRDKLKILFIIPEIPSISQTFIQNQIIALKELGHNICIYSISKKDSYINTNFIKHNLRDIIIYSTKSLPRFRRYLALALSLFNKQKLKLFLQILSKEEKDFLSTYEKIYWILDLKIEYDIIHIHFGDLGKYYLLGKKYNL